MEESWALKKQKYGSLENETAIKNWKTGTTSLQHLPIIVTYKGLMYGPSGRGLKDLGLSKRDISDKCLLTIVGSLKCYDLYMCGTRKDDERLDDEPQGTH